MQVIESRLNSIINALCAEIVLIHPSNGLSSPRDIKLVAEINKKTAILNHLQDAMRVINPGFEIRL